MIQINLLQQRTNYNYQETKARLGFFYFHENELEFFANHQDLISDLKNISLRNGGVNTTHIIPGTQNPIIYNLEAAIEKIGREEVQKYWQRMARDISFDAIRVERLISRRRKRGGAISVSISAAAALLFVFQDHIKNLLPREQPSATEIKASSVPEMPKSEIAPPEVSNPPAPILKPPATPPPTQTVAIPEMNHQAEQKRMLQERYEQIISEMHQCLNHQGTTLEQCDRATQQWTEYPNNPDQQQMITQWGDVRRRVVMEQNIRVALKRLLVEGDRNGAALSELDQLVNPNGLSPTTVESAIADWQRAEFVNHPQQAEMLRSWRRWKSLLALQEKIHELVPRANATLPRQQ